MLLAEGRDPLQGHTLGATGRCQAAPALHQQRGIHQHHCRHAQHQSHQPVPEQGTNDGAGKQQHRRDEGGHHAPCRGRRVVDGGEQHVRGVQAQRTVAVAVPVRQGWR
ncbi:hypothetical protein G6F40_016847 [Rhizopus arrhizus]|nr:hypothetical protein G6F40_016847 [Rhizopus arrhizus]